MLRVIGNDQNLPRQTQEIASGTLPSGKPVVVNANGTVSVVEETAVSQAVGSPTVFEQARSQDISAVYDPNTNKVVIAYRDDGNSEQGTAIVGTVSNMSISFGSPVVFEAALSRYMSAVYDPNTNKIVIAYSDGSSDGGNNGAGTAIVGTVSGTSISFGTAVVFDSDSCADISAVYDTNAQKVVISYKDGGNSYYGTAIVGTVSGTSISFGSAVVFESAVSSYTSIIFDSNSNKVVIAYSDEGNSSHGTAIVGTVSGTSISFGSPTVFNTANTMYVFAIFDSNANKVVIGYRDQGNSAYGTAVVGTVSGTSISFGSAVVFESALPTNHISGTFDSNANKVVFTYQDGGNSDYGTAAVGTVSGTSISFDTPVVFNSSNSISMSVTFDSNAQRLVIAYRDVGSSSYGNAVVFRNASSSTNITSENYIGIARSGAASGAGAIIDTQGAIAEVDTEVTTTGFVISSGSYDSKSFSVASQETSPKGVFFKTDGTKMYVIGTAGGAVFQYGLSTAFDISTASYDSVTLTDFNVVGTNRNGADLFFHPDGTYVFIVETTNQTNLVRLTLSTPWDLSTAGSKVTNSSLPTNKASSNAQGIFFKPDGSKMYLCENRNAGTDVHGFDLSTNWDISSSSVSSDSSFETTAQDNEIGGLFLNTDGSEFYLIGYQNDKVYRYTISTPYDISTSTFADDFSVGSQETQPQAVTFKPDGTKMYVVGFTNDTVYQYSTSTSVGGPITAGQSYYVQTDGTLSTTADDPSVFAGTAVSATELIVKG